MHTRRNMDQAFLLDSTENILLADSTENTLLAVRNWQSI